MTELRGRELSEGALADDVIADFMTRRFEGRWATPDGRFRRWNGRLSPPVPFWSAVQNRAEELLEGIADPTRDYVMTEVVHSKSRSEVGEYGRRADTASRDTSNAASPPRRPLSSWCSVARHVTLS